MHQTIFSNNKHTITSNVKDLFYFLIESPLASTSPNTHQLSDELSNQNYLIVGIELTRKVSNMSIYSGHFPFKLPTIVKRDMYPPHVLIQLPFTMTILHHHKLLLFTLSRLGLVFMIVQQLSMCSGLR